MGTALTWFGESWGSEGNEKFPKIPTPVGERCDHCFQPFLAWDCGIASHHPLLDRPELYHRTCWAPKDGMLDAGSFDEFGPPG